MQSRLGRFGAHPGPQVAPGPLERRLCNHPLRRQSAVNSNRPRRARLPREGGLSIHHRRSACQTESGSFRAQRAGAAHDARRRRRGAQAPRQAGFDGAVSQSVGFGQCSRLTQCQGELRSIATARRGGPGPVQSLLGGVPDGRAVGGAQLARAGAAVPFVALCVLYALGTGAAGRLGHGTVTPCCGRRRRLTGASEAGLRRPGAHRIVACSPSRRHAMQRHQRGRRVAAYLIVAAAGALSATGGWGAVGASTSPTVHACADKKTGALRLAAT
jgi:hypothetical protein